MPKRNTKTKSNLILISSVETKLSETAKSLSFLARQAHLNKDFKNLAICSENLINLSAASEETGRFFYSLSQSQYGEGDLESAYKILTELSESKSTEIRAASLLAIGRKELSLKNYEEAGRTFLSSAGLAMSNRICAPLTYIQSQIALSAMYAEIEAYDESLLIMQGVEPLVKSIASKYPALLGEYWNNLACGYLELDELEAAFYYSSKAVSMKVAAYFPEWFATKSDIDHKLYEKNYKKLVSFLGRDRSASPKNVQQFTSKLPFYIALNFYGTGYNLLKFITDESEEAEIRFTALIETLASLCVGNKTGIELLGYFLFSDHEYYKFKGNLSRQRIDDLGLVMDNVERFELNNPLKEYGSGVAAALDITLFRDTLEWVKSFIDEGVRLNYPWLNADS
jgi:hypothetical protein